MGLETSNQFHEPSVDALQAREPYLIAGTSTGLLQALTGKKMPGSLINRNTIIGTNMK